MILSDADIEAIRKRCEDAEPGPWLVKTVSWGQRHNDDIPGEHHSICGGDTDGITATKENITLMAHAREDIPNLLADRSAFEAASRAAQVEIAALTEKVKALEDFPLTGTLAARFKSERDAALEKLSALEAHLAEDTEIVSDSIEEEMDAILAERDAALARVAALEAKTVTAEALHAAIERTASVDFVWMDDSVSVHHLAAALADLTGGGK